MITGVHHTSFTVSDMARSIAFYRDVLGLKLLNQREMINDYLVEIVGYEDLHMHIAFLAAGSDLLELIQYEKPQGKLVEADIYNPGMAHMCFAVDDMHEMYGRLVAAGVKTRSEPVAIPSGPNKGGYAVYLADPDGFVLEMIQRPPQAQ
jgi:lactoylglutathione lyase